MAYELRLFTGNANRPLAEEIAQYLHLPLGDADVTRFSDGEIFVQINENVRGADVFIVQPTCPPVNDTLMELLIMIDALKRASAHRITAVLPYYGYARQDRKVQPRVPDHRQAGGRPARGRGGRPGARARPARRPDPGVLQHPGRPPVRGARASSTTSARRTSRTRCIVSPDAGGVERARAFAKRLKRRARHHRQAPRGPERRPVMHLIGDVEGKDAVVIDDMIDTAGTLVQAVGALEREGARRILACGVHPCCRARPSSASRRRPSRRSSSRTRSRSRDKGRRDHRAERGAAPGRGHPAHPRRGIRLDAVRMNSKGA